MAKDIRDDLRVKIYSLIQKYSTHEDLNLSDAAEVETLGVDSIDLMEIVFRLEETHGVEIDDLGMEGVKTLGDIVDLAVANLRKDA